jgi:hypothetical protein
MQSFDSEVSNSTTTDSSERSDRCYWRAIQRFPRGVGRIDWLEAERAIEREAASLAASEQLTDQGPPPPPTAA